jgi:hypothetical protein
MKHYYRRRRSYYSSGLIREDRSYSNFKADTKTSVQIVSTVGKILGILACGVIGLLGTSGSGNPFSLPK